MIDFFFNHSVRQRNYKRLATSWISCTTQIKGKKNNIACRHALDIREHYERKLERANNLYMELNAIMLQLEIKEKELHK